MSTSSARPADLDAFVRNSRAADQELLERARQLRGAYEAFERDCKWGTLDATSLLCGLDPQFLEFNEGDARWVEAIAAAFERAGRDGEVSSLPDAAIAASLRRKRLCDTRQSVTFDDPVAYGFPPTTGYANDPVNTASGNFVEAETDLAFGGLLSVLAFTRTYNSRSDRIGAFGRGWASWATARLRTRPDGAEYEGPDGQRAVFPRLGAGYGRVLGVNALVQPLASGATLDWFGGGRWEFDDAGLPVSAQRGPGTEVRFCHDADGRLVELAHAGGKVIVLEWEGERVAATVCSDGQRVDYTYDERGDLVEADSSMAGPRRYELDEDGRVVAVSDADGVREVLNTYDENGLVQEQVSSFGRRTMFAYLPGHVTVTSDEQGGPANTYLHDRAGRLLALVDGDGERFTVSYDEWGNPVAVSERNGAITVQEWDERSRLTRRTLPTGASYAFRYDDADRVVEVAMSTGELTRLRYDGDERTPAEILDPEGGVTRMTVRDGLLREVVDPDGVRVRFDFDADGNIVAATDADGNIARLERDPTGRVTAAITPSGRRTTLTYDPRGRPLEHHDPAGAIWRYEHTEAGRLAALVDPTGAREQFAYDSHGELASVVDALGNTTSRRYDVLGNLVGIVAPDGAAWSLGYDALCRLVSVEDPAGATWRREYDANGNLTASVDPLGTRHSATIDLAGRVSALNDGVTSSAFEFDVWGRCLTHSRPDGAAAAASYDRCGRRIAIEDPIGGVTRLEYTAAGRLRRAIAPSGRTDDYEYDRCGRLAAHTDGAGRRREYRYDADGAIIEQIASNGEVERYRYDDAGRLVERTAPGEGATTYAYDAAGRVVEITDRVAGTRRFEYDATGQLVAATDANGGITRYAYNARGWLTEVVDPIGGRVTRDYDPLGRLVAETDPLGRTTTLAYDAAGRVIERVDGSGRRMRWTYDASGRVHTYGAAGQPPITIERDTLGRPVRIDEPGAQSNRLRWDPAGRLVERARGELALTWRYDEDGRRAALGYPDGTETAYSYDPGGLLSALHHPALGRIDLQRDPAGRLVGAVGDRMRAHWGYTAGELTEYEIDAGGRHRSAQLKQDERGRVIGAHIDGAAQRFTYDPGGQLISATTPDGTLSFSYDANGRLTHETTPAGDATYEYDSAGQLRSVQRPGTTPTRFTYDGAGRRIRELAEHGTRTYAWDPLGRLSAIQTSPAAAPERAPTTVTVDALGELAEVDAAPLLWDTADPWTPLSWIAGTAVVGHGAPWALAGTRAASWLAPDWHGTVGLDRDPWGATPPDTAPAAPLQLGYRGELELDGLTWLRNRIYQPATRAFLAPDPLPAVPGTPWSGNPNHYAGNNPISLADPLGLRPVTDAELAHYRDQMANPLQKAGHWVHDNWQFIAAGAVLVGGIALMATGVGGPIGGAMVAGVLLSGAFSAGFQKVTTGHVDWRKAALDGAIGGLAAGAGAGAGAVIARAPMLADASVPVQAAVRQGAEGLVTGAGDHVLRGEDPITWSTLASAGIGAGAGATGGWLGTRAYVPRHGDWSPAHAGVAGRHAWTPAHAGIPGRHAWTPREETNREKIAKYPSAVGGMTAEKVLDTEPEEHVILPGPFPVLQ